MTCEAWDVVVVPFPFVGRPEAKRRPALVLTREDFNRQGHTILAMITTRGHPPWPGDVVVRDRTETGLPKSCLVRLKIFTLDNRLIVDRLGRLADADREAVADALGASLAA